MNWSPGGFAEVTLRETRVDRPYVDITYLVLVREVSGAWATVEALKRTSWFYSGDYQDGEDFTIEADRLMTPSEKTMKKYGRRLRELVSEAEKNRERRQRSPIRWGTQTLLR